MTQRGNKTRRKKVLFVCIGNSCRSQMAEALARHYAPELIEAESAGLRPLGQVAPEALAVLQEMGIRAEGHYSKSINDALQFFEPEMVVNMSGQKLKGWFATDNVVDWKVQDPYGSDLEIYRQICDNIDEKVKKLVSDLSDGKK
ncbi:MAG TPA: arsenate reductase ArsC [Candidatus Acidoferrales bacterium]|nr:arsenate reductase ArsC [Candidatus Acidoferrales bacterium]